MAELAAFQAEFLQALFAKDAPLAKFGAGLAVHRNTIAMGLINALAAGYPTIEQLVGRDWLRACANEYVRAHPPRTPVLALYGETFPEFLSQFAPAAELPYLADVARIDRLWSESHNARDAACLAPDALARLGSASLFEQRLSLHSATRFGSFRDSAVTIWKHHRTAPSGGELQLDGAVEWAVITRPDGAVECQQLDAASFVFFERIAGGATLGEAATAALETDSGTDVATCLARLVAAGAFATLQEYRA
jgi:hypothetical protein